MKINWQWPAALVFSVVFACVSALVYFGKVPAYAMTTLLAWLIPSPFVKGDGAAPADGGAP